MGRPEYLVTIRSLEHRLHQVLFLHVPSMIQYPAARVVIGQENVMQMDNDAGAQGWNDVQ